MPYSFSLLLLPVSHAGACSLLPLLPTSPPAPYLIILLMVKPVSVCDSTVVKIMTDSNRLPLQARYNVQTSPEPILSVQGRTNPERILNHNRTVAEQILLIRSATVLLWSHT